MTPVMSSASATRPRLGPVATVIAKSILIALTAWLGYALICALAGAVLGRFGLYAEHLRWAIVTAWVLFSIRWVWRSDLNNY